MPGTVLKAAEEAAREAGALLLRDFHHPGGPRGAGDHAEADLEAEQIIRARLTSAFPWSFLGEETGAAKGADPSRVWLVDPNDGTNAYLKGWRGPAVSIGLVHDGVPVLGVVFAHGFPDGDGDLISWAEGAGPIRRNGTPVANDLAAGTLGKDDVVLVSQAARSRAEANARLAAPARFLAVPSIACRLALAAAGEGVAAVSLHGAGDWDYAAGHALIRAAGGVLVDEAGRPVVYARDGRSSTRRCFGGAPAAVAELCRRPWEEVEAGPRESHAGIAALLRPARGRACADTGRLRRAQGCLLGQLAGDALGSLVEFQRPETIRRRHPDGVRNLADGGTFDTLAGQPTDDSEMALMLARSLVLAERFDPGAVLDAYVHWYRSGPFDIGNTTAAALGAAAAALTPAERLARATARASAASQANGSVMRASPLGIFSAGKPLEAAARARTDSALTHPHPVCQASSAALVAAISVAIDGGSAADAHAAALAAAGGEPAVADALRAAGSAPPEDFLTHEGWVLVALRNAFFHLLHSEGVEEALVATVGQGGDTDTNAAIAGALLGALRGRDAIPARWRRRLLTCRPLASLGARRPRPSEFWPTDALLLAELLLAADLRSS